MSNPLSDDAIIGRATYLRQLDLIDAGVDAIERSHNSAQRKETVAALRVQLNLLRDSYNLVDNISYFATHEKGRKALANTGVNARKASSNKVIILLEREWDTLDPKPKYRDRWVQNNYKRICTEAYGKNEEKWISEDYFKRLLMPSQRPKK